MTDIQNSINLHGYEQAQTYYHKLKEKLLNNIVRSKQIKSANRKIIKQIKKIIQKDITNTATETWIKQFDLSKETLSTLENLVSSMLTEESKKQAKAIVSSIDQKASQTEQSAQKQNELIKKEINKNTTHLLSALQLDRQFFENMFKSQIAANGADITDLTNHGIAYFTRFLYSQLTDNINKLAPVMYARALSLSGFYQEAAEYKILNDLFKNSGSNMRVYHAGSKNTELDIIISELTDLETILNKNINIQEVFQLDVDDNILEQQLIQQINWFGEQVKSWSFSSNALTYSIGSRHQLLQDFLGEQKESYSSLEGARFLAKFKNILLALGPSNVLFATGNKRYWMADFIKEFRNKNYLLAFARQNEKSPLTSHVVLENYKTVTGNIRARYLNNI